MCVCVHCSTVHQSEDGVLVVGSEDAFPDQQTLHVHGVRLCRDVVQFFQGHHLPVELIRGVWFRLEVLQQRQTCNNCPPACATQNFSMIPLVRLLLTPTNFALTGFVSFSPTNPCDRMLFLYTFGYWSWGSRNLISMALRQMVAALAKSCFSSTKLVPISSSASI